MLFEAHRAMIAMHAYVLKATVIVALGGRVALGLQCL